MRSHLGYTLKCHRIAAGLTRAQVAVRTGFSMPYIVALEQGRASSVSAISRVLRCYGMSIADLLVQDDVGREQGVHDLRCDAVGGGTKRVVVPIAGCIRDAVSDYPQAMAVGDLSGRELA